MKRADRISNRYAFAAVSVLLAFLLRLSLSPVLKAEVPLIFFFLSVVFSGLYRGTAAGLFATALSTLIGWFVFIRPYSPDPLQDKFTMIRVGLFLLVSALASVLTGTVYKARRRAEESESRERAQREQFRVTLSSIGDGVIATDPQGRVTFLNEVAEALTGWSQEEAEGRSLGEVFNLAGTAKQLEMESLTAGAPESRITVGSDGACILTARDGAERPIEATSTPIKGMAGERSGAVLVFRDITERRQSEIRRINEAAEREQLLAREQAARSQAEEASRLKDDFLATVSHELRTPLNSILGWARMLRGGKLDAEAAARAMETIERNARSQAEIIEDILDVSRIITGRLRLDFQTVDLQPVIEAAIDSLRPAAEARGVRLQPVLDPQAGLVSGDPNRLQQVVWNLLSNAIKFTPRGGRVHVALERISSHIDVTVSDTGVGIRPEFLPYVFDRFRQADSSSTRTHGGLGLGLAIVRHLVELHGGAVTAESGGEGQGATFHVRLPLMTVRSETIGFTGRHLEASGKESPLLSDSLKGVRVLVVDDEADARDLLTAALGQYGVEVMIAASAAEALSAVEVWRPDVLVSDIGMPVEDGYALIRRLRALTPECGGLIPAVALTAYARSEDRLRALSAGYQMHVAKPVDPAELAAVIASLAGRMKAGKQ